MKGERMLICAACAVEYDEPIPEVCPICADDRQWVPRSGQRWTDLAQLAAGGERTVLVELQPGLIGIRSRPGVGIGQQSLLVTTPAGSLLWDPIGYVDDDAVEQILEHGPVLAIAASHPHMFGVQIEWSHRLGRPPVLVGEADREWLGRNDSVVQTWSHHRAITPGLTLHQIGGHFRGSAVALWAAGARGRGVLLTGDSIAPNPDRRTVTFMRSFPNRIPLSDRVVERIAAQCEQWQFDTVIGNFDNAIETGARAALRMSAERHIGWVRGDFDHLT